MGTHKQKFRRQLALKCQFYLADTRNPKEKSGAKFPRLDRKLRAASQKGFEEHAVINEHVGLEMFRPIPAGAVGNMDRVGSMNSLRDSSKDSSGSGEPKRKHHVKENDVATSV